MQLNQYKKNNFIELNLSDFVAVVIHAERLSSVHAAEICCQTFRQPCITPDTSQKHTW